MKNKLSTYILILLFSVPCIYAQMQGAVVLSETDSLTTERKELGNLNRTLIRDSEGNEFVIFNGRIMSADEFVATGGNRFKQEERNREREANAQPSVFFSAYKEQRFGFDVYSDEKIAIQHLYPIMVQDYRPPFKSVRSFQTDQVRVSGNEQTTNFRTE